MLLRRSLSIARSQRLPRVGLHAVGATRSFAEIIHKSPHPELHIPNKTIWDIFTEQLDDHKHRDALICGLSHEKVTFQELHDDAQRVAVALAQDGVKRGDVVLMHSFNCMEYPLVVLALTSLGAVCSTASPMFNAQELAAQAQLANAKFIITNRALEKVAIEAAELSGIDKSNIYTVGASAEPKKLKCINEVSKRDFESFSFEKIDPEANLLLPFSSGTTGTPKGVALSARNMVANTLQVTHIEDFEGRMVSVLPFFHIYAMLLMHVGLYQGASQVVLPRFEPESFLDALSRYKIKKANIAPPIAIFLAHHPLVEQYDLSATKFLVSGGAPMGKEVETLVKKRLNVAVKQAYGMTEASPAVNYTEDDLRKPGSVGRIVPNTELRVKCTLTDKDLQPNQHGELLYRGPQVMIGYLNNEEANKKTLTEDRFLRTGDIGYIDNDGFVHIVDRVKELIKYKGHQVAPAELEDILNHHPGISDACAVRGYDADGQEIPKAYVVLKDPSSGLTPEAVMEFVAERVAPYKKVREVEFIDAVPKSPTGKILRRQLQDVENKRH
ncbi:hypothetical protein Poli38472_002939 [Pythium oligandrum]|uniref:4-coumarate--CoA ligase n=1 Tax=Pythium oligandrum TaxID=41045 RepID=A0A8K1FDK6_PYTOL|nr:hypothetical protein Poli38472_002939 [Pythium oligandrum]|eukprot:TMW57014.1 hypothetical protein Poli38472_002939 [Pythium oligandrum]